MAAPVGVTPTHEKRTRTHAQSTILMWTEVMDTTTPSTLALILSRIKKPLPSRSLPRIERNMLFRCQRNSHILLCVRFLRKARESGAPPPTYVRCPTFIFFHPLHETHLVIIDAFSPMLHSETLVCVGDLYYKHCFVCTYWSVEMPAPGTITQHESEINQSQNKRFSPWRRPCFTSPIDWWHSWSPSLVQSRDQPSQWPLQSRLSPFLRGPTSTSCPCCPRR